MLSVEILEVIRPSGHVFREDWVVVVELVRVTRLPVQLPTEDLTAVRMLSIARLPVQLPREDLAAVELSSWIGVACPTVHLHWRIKVATGHVWLGWVMVTWSGVEVRCWVVVARSP